MTRRHMWRWGWPLMVAAAACGGKPPSATPAPAPSASFAVTPAAPRVNEVVQFTDASTGSPTSWSWTFGDGGTSTAQNPTHIFTSAATVTVSLTAVNASGSSTSTRSLVVAPAATGAAEVGTVLGRPTDSAVAASVRVSADADVFLEYGEASAVYTGQTPMVAATTASPVLMVMSGLRPDAGYYYRVRYRPRAQADFRASPEATFHTQRRSGSAFTFVLQADAHLDGNSSTAVYSRALANMVSDRPDFLIDLGDTSMAEKCVIDGATLCATGPATQASVSARYALTRSYFEQVGHSIPLFMVLGNHDGESGWTNASAPGLDTWSVTTRKALFANPEPDRFYSGSAQPVAGIGLRQNYYAFEWGDALFVVLDPYTYTPRKPGADGWGWTLGDTQYQWLASTLAGSRARFKFVFSHHMLGGNGSETRGGAAFSSLFEWGGRNLDGTLGFDRQRPGWPSPIHQLMVDNRVTAWFHGHDHLYAREVADGVIYQEVPQPSLSRYDTPDPGAGYGYVGTIGTDIFPSSGHLRITVSALDVRVEYVRAVAAADETATRRNGAIIHSYTVR